MSGAIPSFYIFNVFLIYQVFRRDNVLIQDRKVTTLHPDYRLQLDIVIS